MTDLRQLTLEHHAQAERQAFVDILMSGNIHPEFYAIYLWNQHKKYDLLEALADNHNLFADIPEARQKTSILEDFRELWPHAHNPPILPSVHDYHNHIYNIMSHPDSIMAHVYVLHSGDLSGGQMIAKKVPGEGRMYKFDGSNADLKTRIKAKTTDNMAAEARICFEFATAMFQDLMELDCERYLEHTN